MHDVAIIGGGAAGTFAALGLARQDADVIVVSSGPASALMCRGVAFVGGPFPDESAFERLWREVLPQMWQERDRYLGFDGAVVEAGRALGGLAGVKGVEGDDVLVMDVPGLSGPQADVLAHRLSVALGKPVRSSRLKLQYTVDDFGLTPVLWARRFDDQSSELMDHVARRLTDEQADTVLLPPVLGIERNRDVRRALQDRVGFRVMELIGGPGWPPGHRIVASMAAALERENVRVRRGRVVGCRARGDEILAVELEDGEEVRAGRYVLATGGLAGQGLRIEEGLVEAALGLPVFLDGRLVTGPAGEAGVDPSTLFADELGGDHPVLGAGVRTSESGRVLGPDRRPVYRNLWATGSVVERRSTRRAVIDPGASALAGWRVAGGLSAGA